MLWALWAVFRLGIRIDFATTEMDERLYRSNKAKEKLDIFINGEERGESLDHVLLHGPPGLGKPLLPIS